MGRGKGENWFLVQAIESGPILIGTTRTHSSDQAMLRHNHIGNVNLGLQNIVTNCRKRVAITNYDSKHSDGAVHSLAGEEAAAPFGRDFFNPQHSDNPMPISESSDEIGGTRSRASRKCGSM